MSSVVVARLAADLGRRRARLLRPRGFDDLGLRRASSDRLLPFLVAAMAFLALLALAAAAAASALALHWQLGAGATLTVQVPRPLARPAGAAAGIAAGPGKSAGETRQEAVLTALRATPGIAEARAMTEDELNDLLRPWLGEGAERLSLPLPAVIQVRLNGGSAAPDGLAARLGAIAPDVLVETNGVWLARLAVLARSLQACAALMLMVVVGVAVAVVAVATRASLAARREAIDIVHGLGAPDGYIAGRFATRAMWLAAGGGFAGAVAGLPLLLGLAQLAAPFAAAATPAGGGITAAGAAVGAPAAGVSVAGVSDVGVPGVPVAGLAEAGAALVGQPEALSRVFELLPTKLWLAVPALPVVAAAIGWLTAQVTVRRWLLRLP